MPKTTSIGLKGRQGAPLTLSAPGEALNSTSESSKPAAHVRSGCNSHKGGGMSAKHSVFVLGVNGKPLTPTTPAKARKLLRGKQAKPVWNRFGMFGIQMSLQTRKERPNTALGVDFGTKFEGYSVVTGSENSLSVMWLLPDKKKIVRKLEERRRMRRARRGRKCRRRPLRFDNREKKGFIAPSQLVLVQSRLKAIQEFLRCYPVSMADVEDVRFNHYRKRWGKNFSTVEIGKSRIHEYLSMYALVRYYQGHQTGKLRKMYGYSKLHSDKSAEKFSTHCCDSLALAANLTTNSHIDEGTFIVVDDNYRPVRRRMHDTQYSKGGVRFPYSAGNFKGVRKGAICGLGQVCGGTGNSMFIRDRNNMRVSKAVGKVGWLSHRFKVKGGNEPNSSTRQVGWSPSAR